MIRFVLACALLSGSLLLASPSAADHWGPVTTADQARFEIYDRIMTMVSFGKVKHVLGGATDRGKELAYRSYEENKTLAVCIN